MTEYIASSRCVGSPAELVDDRRELVVGHAELAMQGLLVERLRHHGRS